jgi:hypothetical protein
VLRDVVVAGVRCVLWWLVWLGLGRSPVSCVVCDIEGLCMTYNSVKDDAGFCCHLFVQLVIYHSFSVNVEVFYRVQ